MKKGCPSLQDSLFYVGNTICFFSVYGGKDFPLKPCQFKKLFTFVIP
jgi:hypothetical protein